MEKNWRLAEDGSQYDPAYLAGVVGVQRLEIAELREALEELRRDLMVLQTQLDLEDNNGK